MLLKAHNAAFYSGDRDTLRLATTNLNWGVRAANRADGQKIQSYFSNTKKPPGACAKALSLLQSTSSPKHFEPGTSGEQEQLCAVAFHHF